MKEFPLKGAFYPRASLARAAFTLKLSLIPAIDLFFPCSSIARYEVRLLKVNRRERGTRVRLFKVNRRWRGTRVRLFKVNCEK